MSVHESLTTITEEAQIVLQALRNRRSIPLKQLSPEPIDLGLIEVMLEAANWAPSHGKTEPWRFSVFAGEGRRILSDAFGEAYRQMSGVDCDPTAEQAQRDRVWQAPVWISLGMQPEYTQQGQPRMPEWEELIAVGSAVQNAHIAASALGLGCKWTSGAVVLHPHVAQVVGLQAPAKLLGFLYVGRPMVEWPQGVRRPIEEKVRWIVE
jgi:nitroreductase